MTDEPFDLFDSLLAVRTEWQLLSESYESHAVGLLHGCVDARRLSPGALDRALAATQRHVTLNVQLRACIASLDDLLDEVEDRRQDTARSNPVGVVHTPPVPGD